MRLNEVVQTQINIPPSPEIQYHLIKILRNTIAPRVIASNIDALGIATDRAPFQLPLLVLASLHVDPEWPLLVASTPALIVAVFAVFVNAVVANVLVVDGLDSENAADERKTSAKPGAGTCTWHVLAV